VVVRLSSVQALDAGRALGAIMEALKESGLVPGPLQMVDSTVVRDHHKGAGAKGGHRDKVSAVQGVASRPRYISASTASVSP
jgi:hypothetical protein